MSGRTNDARAGAAYHWVMSSSARRTAMLITVLAFVASACGSTVPKSQLQALLNGNQNQNLGLGTTGGVSPSTGRTTGGVIPGAAGGTTGTGGNLGGTSTGVVTGNNSLGPGITKSSIYVGLVDIKNSGAGNAALGASGASSPVDYRRPWNIVINDLNAKGGIAGRKIVPVWATFDVTSSQTIDQQAQAACSTWTQDNKVFAIFGGDAGGVTQVCTEKAHAINAVPAGDSTPETFHNYPHFIETSGMNIVRQGPVTVKGLAAQNYYTSGARLGIVTWDAPNYREAIANGYLPTLRSIHVTPATQTAYVHVPASFNDLGGMNSDINSAVLRFANEHITHVMIVDGSAGVCAGACLGFEFLNQAQSQRYHPRYGFNDYNYADTSVDNLYPHQQLSGSVAVVWSDSNKSQDVGYKTNATREDCYNLMRKNGWDFDVTNDNQTYVIRDACESFWFTRAVVAKIGGAMLNNDNFMAGVNQIGRSFRSLNTYISDLSSSQHDGASAVRNEQYFDSCTCYKYTSAPYEV